MSANADYGAEHVALWNELREKIAHSLRYPEDAKFVANALFEWPEGNDLLRRIVAHLDAPPNDGPRP